MKTLMLGTFDLSGEKKYEADLVTACALFVPGTGITLAEQDKRLRITRAVETAKAGAPTSETVELSLEDADAETLKVLVKDMRWAVVNEGIAAFGDKVSKM